MLTSLFASARRSRSFAVCDLRILGAFLGFLSLATSVHAQGTEIDWISNIDQEVTESVVNPDTGLSEDVTTNYATSNAGAVIKFVLSVTNDGRATGPIPTTVQFNVPATTTLITPLVGDIASCSPDGTNAAGETLITCDVPPLDVGDTAESVVSLQTSDDISLLLEVDVPDAPDESDTANNFSEANFTVNAGTDLEVTFPPIAPVTAGAFFDFPVEIRNVGVNTANSYRVDVPSPAGVTNITAPTNCTLIGNNYQCEVTQDLAPSDAPFVLDFRGQVAVASGSGIGTTADVLNASPTDVNPANDQTSFVVPVRAGTDASITKSRTFADGSTGNTLLVEDEVIFTLSSQYIGDQPTTATVTDTLPSNYQIESVSSSGAFNCGPPPGFIGQTVSCVSDGSGTGAPGEAQDLGDITIRATVVDDGVAIQNRADIEITGVDDVDPTNNFDEDTAATIEAPFIDLLALKNQSFPALAVINDDDDYVFRIRTRNVGNADFVGTITMRDTIPEGLTVRSLGLNGWTCTVPDGGGAEVAPAFPVAGPVVFTCTREYTDASPLAGGAQTPVVAFRTVATADPDDSGDVSPDYVNRVDVSGSGGPLADGNADNDFATVGFEVEAAAASADISAAKSAADPDAAAGATADELRTAIAGEPFRFDLEVINTGPVAAEDVRVRDTIQNLVNGNTDFVSITYQNLPPDAVSQGSTGACRQDQRSSTQARLNCPDIGTVPICTPGVNCPVISVTVVPGRNFTPISGRADNERSNTFEAISLTTPDPDLDNNDATAFYIFERRNDLTVTKDAPAEIAAGRDLTYTITARNLNNGLSRAENVIITDTLPPDVTFVSVTPPSGQSCPVQPAAGAVSTTTTNNQIVCTVGDLGLGQQRLVSITVRPNFANFASGTPTAITNEVRVDQTDDGGDIVTPAFDINVDNNEDDAVTTVTAPSFDLQVNKSDDVDPLPFQTDTTYTVTVSNNGPSVVEDIIVTDTWPSTDIIGLVGVNPPPLGSCDFDATTPRYGGTVTCTYPSLNVGESFDIEFIGRGDSKGSATNRVSVAADGATFAGLDRLPGNNSTSENTTVKTVTDVLVVNKTGPATPVALGDFFNYVAEVTVNDNGLFDEADLVEFSDTLPSGMVLTGTPSVSGPAGVLPNSCDPATAGDTSFTCALGTVQPGEDFTVTIPVVVTSVSSRPQTLTNTATVTTDSIERDPQLTNNSSSGDVTVLSSTIAGNVFRDFADDVTKQVTDTDIAGTEITLTGTNSRGEAINPVTVLTDANGNFLFEFLEEGTYTVTRGDTNEDYLTDGTNTAGEIDGGGPTGIAPDDGSNTITGIALPDDSDNINNIFRVIPEARIGIAKSGTIDALNADGTFDATYSFVVENFSLETLNDVTVSDTLAGVAPELGTLSTSLPMTKGTYRIITPPSDGCGTGNTSYDGDTQFDISTGGSLASGASCTVTFSVQVFPTDDRVEGNFNNQASATGTGELSGQTPTDLSDDGTNPDPNGNGDATETGENDPTILTPGADRAITLVKTGDTSALTSPFQEGDMITYSFAVTNTGDLTLTAIVISDPLIGDANIPTIDTLLPGETETVQATYPITQPDLDAGEVENTATVTGDDPFGREATDTSGTAQDNDTPTTTNLPQEPGAAVTKTAAISGDQMPTLVGDVITYTFTVRNTGNVTLTDIDLIDTIVVGDDANLTFSGTVIDSLDPGEEDSTSFQATYTVTLDDILAGQVTNRATVSGSPPVGDDVRDVSSPDSFTEDEDTVVNLVRMPALEAEKVIEDFEDTNGDGFNSIGDIVTYAITVTNTGNVPLTNVNIVDTLTDFEDGSLDLTTGPDFDPARSDTVEGALGLGEAATYTATFVADLQAINARGISNTVTAFGDGPGGSGPPTGNETVDDVSDDGNDFDGNTEDDPTELAFGAGVQSRELAMTKTTPLDLVNRGDVIPFTITVENLNIFVEGPFDVVDRLPEGMIYIPGTATIDGAPADVTYTAGRVTWSDLTVDALGSTVLTLDARILNGARSGILTNTVSLIDSVTGEQVVEDASASVRIEADTLFECTDIVGKVFNDVNGNGYQDAPETIGRGTITDQSYEGGKGNVSAALTEPRDESGLPGVRLATVDGTVITTDENGLFSVPCAELPASSGSNFILKVDERSLPAGYRMTTENPRVTRITPGTMTEMNFGAAVALQVVRVDLTAASFVQSENGAVLSPELRSGLRAVLEQISGSPSTLVLSFFVAPDANGEDVALARRLMELVEDQAGADWREVGQVRLRIEQSIVRTGQ